PRRASAALRRRPGRPRWRRRPAGLRVAAVRASLHEVLAHEADRVGFFHAGCAERAAPVYGAFVLPLEGLAVAAAAVADLQRLALRHDVEDQSVREADGET